MLSVDVTDLGNSPVLPRISPLVCRAFNRLYGGARSFYVDLPNVSGDIVFSYMPETDEMLDASASYRFRIGTHTGRLRLDTLTQATLLRERRVDLLPLELRYILLADALEPVVTLLERNLQTEIEWTAPDDDDEAAHEKPGVRGNEAFFTMRVPGDSPLLHGSISFDDEDALDALVPRGMPAVATTAAFDFLRVPLRFRIGATRLSLREVRGIARGDIVSIEEWSAAGSAVRVHAPIGGSGGYVLHGLAEGSRITLQSMRDETMNANTRDASETPADAANLPLDRLDALEVTLQFDLGEISLSLGELKALRPGHVFDLGQPLNRSSVRILAHGNVLGRGHLVAVGDRLGLRVSEFALNAL